MSAISYTTSQLLALTQQVIPLSLSEGARIIIQDLCIPGSGPINPSAIIKVLADIFKSQQACLSHIDPEKIVVEKSSPLTFTVLKSFSIQAANRNNWLESPFIRFALGHGNVLHDVDMMSKGSIQPWNLKKAAYFPAKEGIEQVIYQSHDGSERTFSDMLAQTHTDSIVILQNGSIIYENYFEHQTPDTPHYQMSISKSLIGLIVAGLIVEGIIDPEKMISDYIPELRGSAYEDTKVIEVLDMTTGCEYNEDYADPNSDVRKHMVAAGYLSQSADSQPMTLRTFLTTVKKGGVHNQAFNYVSANTDVLSWLVENATALQGTKTTVTELFKQKIWSKIGAEYDATIIKDLSGNATWAGGFAATTRDMARLGEMVLNRGATPNGQLLSPKLFDWMRNRDLRVQYTQSIFYQFFPATHGWSYANQFWWTHNEHNAFTGVGIHGQLLYIDPVARLVIAKNSSHPAATDLWLGHDAIVAINALVKHLTPTDSSKL